MKFYKLYWAVFLLALFIANSIVSVSAVEADTKTPTEGSVSVTLQSEDTAIYNAELTIYKIAEASVGDEQILLSCTDVFSDFTFSDKDTKKNISLKELDSNTLLQKLDSDTTLQKLATWIHDNSIQGNSQNTNQNGLVRFDGLSAGLYFVLQTESVEGFSDCNPFLVLLPSKEDGKWIYDIDASPKTDVKSYVDLHVKKVWNDGGQKHPDSVSVSLYDGDTVVDSVVLNSKNNWSYTWENREKKDSYTVKESSVPKNYTATYQKDGDSFIVTNTYQLIQTGQRKWPVPVLAFSGVLLFTVGWCIYFRKKKRKPQ